MLGIDEANEFERKGLIGDLTRLPIIEKLIRKYRNYSSKGDLVSLVTKVEPNILYIYDVCIRVMEDGTEYLIRVGDKPDDVEKLKAMPLINMNMDGVEVIRRTDYNYSEVADRIKETVSDYSQLTEKEVDDVRKKAKKLSDKALWKNFIKHYYEAYDIALKNRDARVAAE